jgi:hypothetical protein
MAGNSCNISSIQFGNEIRKFESSHPSQAVRSPPANMRMDHIASRMKLPRFHGFSQATMRSLGKDAPNGRPIGRFGKHTQSWADYIIGTHESRFRKGSMLTVFAGHLSKGAGPI